MLRKIFICAMLAAVLLLSGCGEEKILGSPDKAILAYAETVMTGDSENLSAAGFSEEDKNAIRYAVKEKFIDSMKSIAPLSNESAAQIMNAYFDRFKGETKLSVALSRDNSERPIVALTATTIDQGSAAKMAGKNDEFIALIGMVGKLKSDGATDEQLKENPEVQALAVTAMEKYIGDLTFRPEKTLEIPCKKVAGSDGNNHWAPVEEEAFINFLVGEN